MERRKFLNVPPAIGAAPLLFRHFTPQVEARPVRSNIGGGRTVFILPGKDGSAGYEGLINGLYHWGFNPILPNIPYSNPPQRDVFINSLAQADSEEDLDFVVGYSAGAGIALNYYDKKRRPNRSSPSKTELIIVSSRNVYDPFLNLVLAQKAPSMVGFYDILKNPQNILNNVKHLKIACGSKDTNVPTQQTRDLALNFWPLCGYFEYGDAKHDGIIYKVDRVTGIITYSEKS